MATASETPAHQPALGLWDAVSIILGIIIGAGIYETPPEVFRGVTDAPLAYSLWAICGILVLVGALCYAELATTYPRDGGDYVYLTRAYGSLIGYLFGWTQLAVIQTASIGLMAYVFADYATRLFVLPVSTDPVMLPKLSTLTYACAAIVGITCLNLAGVRAGRPVQNILTLAKIIGLGGIVITALAFPSRDDNTVLGTIIGVDNGIAQVYADEGYGRYDEDQEMENRDYEFVVTPKTRMLIDFKDSVHERPVLLEDFATNKYVVIVHDRNPEQPEAQLIRTRKKGVDLTDLMFVMVLVLLTYGGWNDAAFVAAEVRDPNENIPRALLFGTIGVMAIYLLINWAYVRALGFEACQNSQQIAADVLNLLPGGYGQQIMCVLVMISALGAINGLAFTSARVYATLGADYSLFAWLGRRHPRTDSPIMALVIQMIISIGMVVGVSLLQGHRGGFYLLLQCTAPVFWAFFLLTALSVFVLRVRDPHVERPFKVPAYPILPLLFVATCGYMVYSGVMYAQELGLVGAALVVAGIPFYFLSKRTIHNPVPVAAAESTAPVDDGVSPPAGSNT
jgi:amino acid transporter